MKKIILTLLPLIGMLLFASCEPSATANKEGGTDDKEAEMKARFKTLSECFNTGNTAAVDTLLAANAVDHSADTSMHLPDGPEGLKQMIGFMRTGSPDLKVDIKHMAADGDVLLAFGSMSGTNSGPMMGMPATNKSWSANFCDVIKFGSDMKMVEHWGVYDDMKIMKDLGLMPSAPPPASAQAKSTAPPEKQ